MQSFMVDITFKYSKYDASACHQNTGFEQEVAMKVCKLKITNFERLDFICLVTVLCLFQCPYEMVLFFTLANSAQATRQV